MERPRLVKVQEEHSYSHEWAKKNRYFPKAVMSRLFWGRAWKLLVPCLAAISLQCAESFPATLVCLNTKRKAEIYGG